MPQPAKSLEGRTCLVTGASSGIGEETALALARLGARVVLVCRSRERGERSRAAIAQRSGNDAVDLVRGDLASRGQIVEGGADGVGQIGLAVGRSRHRGHQLVDRSP